MLILGKPHNVLKYIVVNSDDSYILHQLGFPPAYKDGENFYFKKTPELEEILKKGGI